MKQLKTTTLLAATLAATVVLAQPSEHPKPPDPKKNEVVAKIGEPAPAFSLKDQWGDMHTLKQYEGKVIVLEWFNERCPFCKHVWKSGLVPKVMKQLGEMEAEVVYLAVNSTADHPREEVRKSGTKFLEDLEVSTPMLLDYDGEVGHMYGAKTTPHVFIIDGEGVLVYQGALSDDPQGKEGADAQTHVIRAVTQLHEEKEVKPNYVKPWGCSVKYAKGGKNPDHPKRRRPGRGVMGAK